MILKIANASGFWGDQQGACANLINEEPTVDYITFDYLSEMSMSILASQREKDPKMGYAADFIKEIERLIPYWNRGLKFKVIANAGGLNPQGLAKELSKLNSELKIGYVTGDDVLNHKDLTPQAAKMVTANAYLGAKPIVDLLRKGADIIVTGRVADPSLTVAPAVYHFDWGFDEYDKLAQATLAGHLIECGTQVTGGLSHNWLTLPDLATMGFPIIEMEESGAFIVTKPKNSGGLVSLMSVKEQMVYEIGDPGAYFSPEVTASFLDVALELVAKNRVRVTGAKGFKPSTNYKVSACLESGYKAEAYLALFGEHLVEKARKIGEVILERVKNAGFKIDKYDLSLIGYDGVTPLKPKELPLYEAMMRLAVFSSDEGAIKRFTKEIAPLITSGPAGVTGYASGRAPVRKVFKYCPCFIPKTSVKVVGRMVK